MAEKSANRLAPADLPPLGPPQVSLSDALEQIDNVFGIEALLRDAGAEVTEPYYRQSVLVYEQFYEKYLSVPGCMHFGINYKGVFNRQGFFSQARGVAGQIKRMGEVGEVLELGCGKGLNTIFLAEKHPEIRFTGLDLLAEHIEKARARSTELKNVRFMQGSFEPVPEELGPADLAFGVETLCYAKDLDAVCQAIARSLKPGGRLVIYDCFHETDKGEVSAEMTQARRLLEVGWGISAGYRTPQRWRRALARAGLQLRRVQDETPYVLPNVRKLQEFGIRYFDDWKLRMQSRLLPRLGQRNAVTALLMPLLFEGQPDGKQPSAPAVSYYRLVARKPASD